MSRGWLVAEVGRFLRSNLSSIVATGLEWVLVTGLVFAGGHYLVAAAAGALAGAATDFNLKRHWAFQRHVKGMISREAARYLAVSGGSLLLNLGLSWALVDGLALPKLPGVILASIVVGVAFNYPLHRNFVFVLATGGRGEGARSPRLAREGRPLAVVCDFDGTATVEDLADALSIAHLGHERWKRANDAFQAGEFPFEELLRRIFEPIAASREEIAAFTRAHVRFRPGFERLLASCRTRGVRFVLASGGLDVYIAPALALLPLDLVEGLEVRANHAEPVPGGLALTFPYQHAPGACGHCGSCKGAIVKELQAAGHRVVAVGDGNADRCMAGVADVLFARGRLLDWCTRRGTACEPFETLDPVAALVEVAAGASASTGRRTW